MILPPDPVSIPDQGLFPPFTPWRRRDMVQVQRCAHPAASETADRGGEGQALETLSEEDQVQSWIDRKRMISVIQRG